MIFLRDDKMLQDMRLLVRELSQGKAARTDSFMWGTTRGLPAIILYAPSGMVLLMLCSGLHIAWSPQGERHVMAKNEFAGSLEYVYPDRSRLAKTLMRKMSQSTIHSLTLN